MEISPLNFLKLAHQWIQKSLVSFFYESTCVNIQNWPQPRETRGKLHQPPGGTSGICRPWGSRQVTIMIKVVQHVQQGLGWDQLWTDGTGKCSAKMRCCQMFFSLSWRQWVYYHLPGPKAFRQVWTCQGAGNWSGSGIECFSLDMPHANSGASNEDLTPNTLIQRWSRNSGWKIFELSIQQLLMSVQWNCPKVAIKPSEPTWWHGELVEKP